MKGEEEARRALSRYQEEPLREGCLEQVWDRLMAGAVPGTMEFGVRIKSQVEGESKANSWNARLSWERIVAAVEAERGESWAEFRNVYGDWGRDVAM